MPISWIHTSHAPPCSPSPPPPFFLSHSSLCPSKQCSRQDNYNHSLPHTLTCCVYHQGAGGSKAISSWCECCMSLSHRLPLSLSHSQSLMASPAPQTSDLISDISAVIATGTSLHPATSSANAGYFCWELAETWQVQHHRKPKAASPKLWARCASRLSPNLRASPVQPCCRSVSLNMLPS